MAQDHAIPRALAREITDELMEAAKAVLQKHGLAIGKSSSGYGDSYKFTISACNVRLGQNGVNLDSNEAKEFVMTANALFKMTFAEAEAALGTVIYTNPKTGDCILIGYNGRKSKMPVIIQSLQDGKTYFVGEQTLSKVGAVLPARL